MNFINQVFLYTIVRQHSIKTVAEKKEVRIV